VVDKVARIANVSECDSAFNGMDVEDECYGLGRGQAEPPLGNCSTSYPGHGCPVGLDGDTTTGECTLVGVSSQSYAGGYVTGPRIDIGATTASSQAEVGVDAIGRGRGEQIEPE
ncbi:unnamed protein product, partial [Choristocarpus tenellus]